MAYATVADISARLGRQLSETETKSCELFLDDAAVMIDAVAPNATGEGKSLASINMVMRKVEAGSDPGVPMGATQGSQSALGYSQSWTISGGASGELYLSKWDKRLLGISDKVGSHSPVEDIARSCHHGWNHGCSL